MSIGGISGTGGASGIADAGSGGAPTQPPIGRGAATSTAPARGSQPRDPLGAAGIVAVATAASSAGPASEADAALGAYDHLARLLAPAAGRDGRLTRAEADRALAALEGDGQGTAALAARGALEAIAQFQRAQNGRAGDLDLGRGRGAIEMWLRQGDGLAQPTGRALAELARTLALPAPRGRTPHAVPERGLDHAARLLQAHDGGDGRVGRGEMRALVGALEVEGRGSEALAVRLLYDVIDRRDARSGARTGDQDLAAAIAEAKAQLLRAHDPNRNGYSAAEVESFPAVGRALLEVGRLIDGGIIGRPGQLDQGSTPVPGPTPGPIPGPTPPPAPLAFPFDENDPLPAGFAPTRVIDDGSFRVRPDGTVELQGIAGADLAETRLLEGAFAAIWERSTQHRADPPGALAPVGDNGSMRLGLWQHPSGETIHVAHWRDIDDDSHAFYFRRLPGAEPRFELAHTVFLN